MAGQEDLAKNGPRFYAVNVDDSTTGWTRDWIHIVCRDLKFTPLGPATDTGEQFDNETGFTFLRGRYLDPRLGRFLSMDSVQPNAPGTQGYNPYATGSATPRPGWTPAATMSAS
ncbi:MAG: hypothetical protein A2Y61_07945 [Chloroflexi bacterium RBG_13_60_13]|nr:MAG: hypothetical protein A2Y61_07945 [Chloroflexi bacterium RBG_13_60_13]